MTNNAPQKTNEYHIVPVHGESVARALSAELVSSKMWFQVEEGCNDEWVFTFHPHNQSLYLDAVRRLKRAVSS